MRFLVVALVGATLAQCRQPPRASTDCGPMFGSWDEEFPSIASFRGIPYGAPPVGRAGRWKPPQKASCWEGDLNATTEGNKCYQFFGPFGDLSLDPGDQKESEDCLNLDVFTNNLDGNRKLPVFVWIYGGSLVMGSTLDYGPIQRMVQLGDVVLVAMNYRINSLGFFTHPLLDAEDPRGVSGNYGLLDQQLALAFVQKNIHRFGGDASRVTVIGQSSGGTSIFGLLASPGSLGLFSGAISLSGSPNITISRTAAQVLQSPLVDATNCSGSSDVLACMYALSPKQIEKSTPNSWLPESFFPTHPGGNGFVPMPIVDGVTIPRPLLEALSSGLIDVPTIIQSARDEDDGFANAKMLNLTANEFKVFLQDHFAAWANETGDKLYQAYAQQAAQADGHGYYDLDADIGMTCAGPALATAAGKGFKSPVYVSVVMQPPSSPVPSEPTLPFATMPFHGWDFATGFGIWKKGFSPASADYAVGEVMRAQWLALAYNATLEDSPHAFPSYQQGAVTGLQYAQGVTAVSHYKRDVCEMLVDLGLGQGYWWIN